MRLLRRWSCHLRAVPHFRNRIVVVGEALLRVGLFTRALPLRVLVLVVLPTSAL